jgi:hypothetical protein
VLFAEQQARRAGNRPLGGGRLADTIPTALQAEQLREVYGLVRTRGWYGPVNLICTAIVTAGAATTTTRRIVL